MVKEFKAFVLRGNVVDLAVGIVIGAAFGALVTAFVKDLVTPLIAAIGGKPDFAGLYFTVNNSKFLYGDFINAIIAFLIIALVIFLFVVKPLNAMLERQKRGEAPPDPSSKKCPECLSEIPLAARKCMYCQSPQTAGSGA